MLRLLIGKAGSGKTAAVIEEIKNNVEHGIGGSIMLVPEQYSHEAERELCRVCGDRLSLYAEVLSFTGLARKLAAKQGGTAAPWLDKGGRLLCMALALKNVSSRLKVYSAASKKAEMQTELLKALDELKAAGIGAERLAEAAGCCDDILGEKLSDLSLISESYDAVVSNGRADPSDRLTVLAEQIDKSGFDRNTHVYVDGFVDFTHQEMCVLTALLRCGAELTVCLTVDSMDGSNEIFELSRRAGRKLLAAAEELGQSKTIITSASDSVKDDALCFFTDNMFAYSDAKFEGKDPPVRLLRAESMSAECEQAAAICLELVRSRGCRYRDIAIAVRGYDEYCPTLESVFRHYGVPLYSSRKSELREKALPELIDSAYAIIRGGWDIDDVISYIRTGLAGLDMAECDILEDYIFKWQLSGSAWTRRPEWHQHPEGYGGKYTEETEKQLERINDMRRRVFKPLAALAGLSAEAGTAAAQAKALTAFFAELKLPEQLARRSEELARQGREKDAAEYRQLWDLTVNALEQCDAILGESEMDTEEFSRLFMAVLSRYDIGTIPVALDRVSAGDFDRSRRRSVKQLIVLGATDRRIPQTEGEGGIFTSDERSRLPELELEIDPGGDSELWREFSLIYNTLTLPSEGLTLIYPVTDGTGSELSPAYICSMAEKLLGIKAKNAELSEARLSARAPALSVAAQSFHVPGGREQAAAEYFRAKEEESFRAVESAANMSRGRLSPNGVEQLYGRRIKFSASKIDTFAKCRFSYFCRYGLGAKPYEPAGFKPPEIGTFMHFVLENTAKETMERGGFKAVDDEALRAMCDKYIDEYAQKELNGFQEKSSRFMYLFKRLRNDVYQVVCDMAAELRRSDFEPLDFELDFAGADDLRPLELGDGEDELIMTGIADRVDGWLHDGKLYVRVADYKTGKKSFSLSDIWYGMSLQMLMYLFVLQNSGWERYGHEVVPGGVMYIPARNPLFPLDADIDDSEIQEKRDKELRRSGIMLNDPLMIEAWETGDRKIYIPIKLSRGKVTEETLMSGEQLNLLNRHIGKTLRDMAKQLRQGNISADPYYRTQQENACANCDYYDACHFSDGENGESCRYQAALKADRVWELMEEEDNG